MAYNIEGAILKPVRNRVRLTQYIRLREKVYAYSLYCRRSRRVREEKFFENLISYRKGEGPNIRVLIYYSFFTSKQLLLLILYLQKITKQTI